MQVDTYFKSNCGTLKMRNMPPSVSYQSSLEEKEMTILEEDIIIAARRSTNLDYVDQQ